MSSPPPPRPPPPPTPSTTTATTTTTTPNPMTAPTTHPPSNQPSKLPSRPRKLRKLSPESSSSSKLQLISLPPKPQPRSLSSPGEIDSALRYLRSADARLSSLIEHHLPPSFDTFLSPFLALSKSILFQQLAFKAGSSIFSRFVSLCGGESNVLPSTVLHLSPPQLRQIGVSARKASYLHDLARKYENGILSDKAIVSMDDKSLFTMLTMVNGIGSWSVHMFMIFSLHRPDVLPVNDLGVRKGVQMLYELEELPRPSQMDQLCENWRPYRSVGAWYMWRLVEAKGASSGSPAVAAPVPKSIAFPYPQPVQSLPPPSQQHQHPPQFIDPVNGIMNIGSNFAQLN